jgi:hypothetical protein
MITLSPASITTTTAVFNGTTLVTTTDILIVSYVELNLPAGSVVAMIDRGTMVEGVFTPNQPRLRVDVDADGTFRSQDGVWSGTLPDWSKALPALASSLDGLLLSAGLVSGTAA